MTPMENCQRVFGPSVAKINRILIVFQYLIYILLNIMLTKRCVNKVIWDTQVELWKTCVSFGVVCVS